MGDPLEPTLRAFFDDYAAAFDAFDAERIASFLHCPCLMVNGEFVAALTTREAAVANMRAVLDHHRREGVGKSRASELRFERQAPKLAIATVRWRVADTQGAPLWDFANTYNLADYGDGFRILVSTTHAPDGAASPG